jgi:hypothetical protein
MRRLILIVVFAAAGLSSALASGPARAAGAAVLRETAGLVQVREDGSERWKPAGKLPRPLSAGDSVRTGFNARAVIAFDGGATLEAAGNTQVSLDAVARGGAAAVLAFGSVRVSARSLGGRALELRTPTAIARARSEAASWRAVVGGGGSSVFEVADGLIAVEDSRGAVLRLREGERLETDLAGLHEPTQTPSPARARRDDFAERMRRELALDQEADGAQRLVSNEARREEYELGHVLTNAAGASVRAEEFVVRTGPSSFEFVALNESRGSGLSWYSWSGVFSSVLPYNLAPVFAILPGSAGAAAPWTLTAYTAVSSNGIDSLVSSAAGGHQVDVNHNADPTDDVSLLYNPSTDLYSNVAGLNVYKVIFDRGGTYSDGVLKFGWTGTNLQSQNDQVAATTNDPLTGAALAVPLSAYTFSSTYPNAGSVQQTNLYSFSDAAGTSIEIDDRAVSFGGGVVSRAAFGGAASGPSWDAGLLRSAFQQTATASEFGGRSINVMLSPRILVETGGLP